MEEILHAMRVEAQRVDSQRARARFGTVTSYDPDKYAVKLRLQPEGYETGWARLGTPMAGNGFGFTSPPEPGDQAWVDFEDGSSDQPVVLGFFYSDEDRPVVGDIKGTPAREQRFVGRSGQRIRLLADGSVEIRGKTDESVVKINADGSVDVRATVVRVGAVGATMRKLVNDTFRQLFNTHVHGNTPVPTQQMTDSHFTTNLSAS